ncbi:PREDICTED: phosphoprotein associated with glycosphingolipid-enriched microdomains 1 [Cyprinodon variegatus]|uniref:Phosphoprotein membrane anchor with glycosphingolipid microdomains 1 n=1 Tax=Cyprinodon variegatus TaxID=28743 RepID=A0A3Q2FEV1_CYPVA|nr:PREDICTED: phosphoprotein associated with glycosphingolipid-enriched microdomains 1 [Cyprinodon variegatus]XP_015235123.1 PREDICTED: phosphoprotein associated with glycosphingolipid-enriched microdomains 1 [Cyprinodon variegatus]
MAPLLSGVRWLSEAGAVGFGTAAASGTASWPQSEQLVWVVALSIVTGVLLLSVLLGLCASCRGQKKAKDGQPTGDQENLVNGVSEREMISQSADSPVTDAAVSSSHNGPLTSGTILSDTQDTSPQLSEDLLSSQSELRSSKCPQDRELPSLPPGSGPTEDRPPASGDSTYEVVKEIEVASRDVSVEDSLYETVKEMKDVSLQSSLANGGIQPSPNEPPPQAPALVNGHPSPCTPERGPLCEGVEYASVDLRKKSRHSADMEAKRCSDNAAAVSQKPADEPEEESPPPVPMKVLDENDNQPLVLNGGEGAGLHNGELESPVSPPPEFGDHPQSDNASQLYSTVNKPNCDQAINEEDKEHDYSSIAELKGLVPASSSSDLYATVHDLYAQPDDPQTGEMPHNDSSDPGYESIRIPKTGSSDDDHVGGNAKPEPDYESVGELGLDREMSRL